MKGVGVAAAAAAGLDALVLEPRWLEVTTHDVPVSKLPRELDGFTLAQVTDAHLKQIGAVEKAIPRALDEHAVQLLVLTGDILDQALYLPVLKEFCAGLRRPGMTAVATLGNWEHWGAMVSPELTKAYAQSGTRLLVNEGLTLSDGVRLFATDDSRAGNVRLEDPSEERAFARLLLTHSPEFLDRVPREAGPFSLALAGHTHGGQVRAGAGLVPFLPDGSGRFVAGWYDLPAGPAYVSRGTGTSILPIRFTCRPELAIFRLRQA